jgi:[ribosomal protein S5]-alanine N-acetyltransferase
MLEPPRPPLRDRELTLRPPDKRDLVAIGRILDDPGWRAAFGPATQTPDELLEWNRKGWRDGRAATFAICAPDDVCVGHVWLNLSPLDAKRAAVGYWLQREARGMGFATRAVKLVSAWAFRELGLARLAVLVEPANRPSQRVAELAGFQREGVLRSYADVGERRVDYVSYSLLPGDRT